MSPTAQQTAVVTTQPPDRKRTLSALGAVAVIALVAFGLVRTFADDSTDEATSPTSTVPSSTTIPTSTSAPPTTAAPATTAPQTSTTLAPPAATTTIPYVNQRPGVVLDAAQNGQSIYFVNGVDLYRIELETGRVTSRRFTGASNAILLYGFVDGRVVLAGVNAQDLGWLAADLSGELTKIELGEYSVMGPSSVGADGIWVMRYSSGVEAGRAARRIDLAGRVRAEVNLPANIYPAGFLGDRAVIAQFGRIWTVATDGRPVPYATGDVVVVRDGAVLWVSCDDTIRCTFHLGNATNPDVGKTSLETSYLAAWPNGQGGMQQNALAPDGRTVVGVVLNNGMVEGRQKIVDLATGSAIELSGSGTSTFGWTPNGDWLIEPTLGVELAATNVRTGRKVNIAYPAFSMRNNLFALVVG